MGAVGENSSAKHAAQSVRMKHRLYIRMSVGICVKDSEIATRFVSELFLHAREHTQNAHSNVRSTSWRTPNADTHAFRVSSYQQCIGIFCCNGCKIA